MQTSFIHLTDWQMNSKLTKFDPEQSKEVEVMIPNNNNNNNNWFVNLRTHVTCVS